VNQSQKKIEHTFASYLHPYGEESGRARGGRVDRLITGLAFFAADNQRDFADACKIFMKDC
jgi:hypothetical protein